MYGKTGEPKDGNTKIAGQGRCRTENVECGKELDMQNETDKQILSTLNQDNFQNSSGGKKAAEDDEMGLFSQGFMDRMREMVSEQFGEEAAERFMVQNKDMIKEEKTTSAVPESEKRLPQTKTADAHTEQSIPPAAEHPDISEETATKGPSKRSHRRWVWRAAAVLVVVLAGFGVHRAGSVSATKIPAVNTAPETTASIDYSKIGSLKDIISTLDYTSFPTEIKQIYVPGVIAEGYKETDCEKETNFINIFYENDGNGWYQYRQVTVQWNTFLDTEEGDWDSLTIGQYPGVYINKGETGNLWWFDYTYAYQLQGNLSEEEMIAVAESLLAEK
ncbi:MAG: DUF4367 domain-containing protein [Coprococcus catus]|nr:DUF4367 domain-containing protein [Coprococcus catus]